MKNSMKIIATNRKAKYDYHVIENFEAGVVLKGTEVKSIKAGTVNLKESYAKFLQNELWIVNMHVSEYSHGNIQNHIPTQSRKLLLHKKELRKLDKAIKEKGLTIVPLKIYLTNGKIKIQIGLCKGKKAYDKRETTKSREVEREMRREIKNFNQ